MLSGSLQEQYQQLCQPMQEKREGRHGMHQHVFVRKEDADKLLAWLKQQAVLQPLGIQNASVRQELEKDKKVYVVRLTTRQYQAIVVEEAVQNNSQKVILSEEERAFVAQDNPEKETRLHKVARDQIRESFQIRGSFLALLAKASPEAINEALPKQDLYGYTGLHAVALYESEESFVALLAKASVDAINEALPKQDDGGWTGLHEVARNQSETSFLALLTKASPEAINEALPKQNRSRKTLLHIVARYQSEASFLALLAKASPGAINEALVKQGKARRTVLNEFPFYQSFGQSEANKFHALLAKASPETINQALPKQNQNGWTLLYTAAYFRSETSFLALLTKVSPEAINEALPKKTTDGWTGLHAVACYQSEASFLALLVKVSSDAINAALPEQTKNKERQTVLLWLAALHSSKAFIALLEKSSSDAVNAAFSKQPARLLELLFSYHAPEAIARLLGSVNFDCIQYKINKMPDSIVKKVASCLLYEPSWQEVSLVQKLFAQMDQQLMRFLLGYYFDGNDLSKAVQDALLQILKAKHPDQFSPQEASWLGLMMSSGEECAELVFSTKNNRKIPLNGTVKDDDVIKYVLQEGLASWQDYRLLRRLYANKPGMLTVLDELRETDLRRVDCLIIDSEILAADELAKREALQNIMSCIEQNKGLLKIIRPEHWDEFFRQIKNYNDRPPLRTKEIDKRKATHKFVHLTGEVVAYHPRRANLPNIKQYTKKTSTTLFTRNLSMSVFGEHARDRLLVGLLFDRSKCRVKAFLAKDSGTYQRKWLGTEEDAKEYKKYIATTNYTNEDEFAKQVNANPNRLNEVLAELSRESLLAIVMVTKSDKAKVVARERQEQIRRELKIDLPIVYYNRVERKLKESGQSVIEETKAEEKLLRLECELRSKNWQPSIQSQLNPLRLFTPQASRLPGTAAKMLEKIEAAKQSAREGWSIWKETMEEVKSLLEAADKNTSLLRSSDDSKQFYRESYKSLSGKHNQ